MLSSMTGYASAEARIDGWLFVWEFRSVNHRYLDLSVRLPDGFRALESQVRQLVGGALRRGKVDVALSAKRDATRGWSIELATAARVIEALHRVAELMPDAPRASVMDVLRWPGVFLEADDDGERLSGVVLDTAANALDALVAARRREGQQLLGVLRERVDQLRPLGSEARERRPMALEAMRAKLQARLAEFGTQANPERLEQELVYSAQRLDVAEEIDRLEAHLTEVEQLLQNGGSIGRKLDFLMQELHREANTLGSKAGDIVLTRLSVEMKVLIEQMREQVQNIE